MSRRNIRLQVVEHVPAGHNGLPHDLNPGDTVYRFLGNTYGCCSGGEIPISLEGSYVNPFRGVPGNSVVVQKLMGFGVAP